MCSAHWTHIEGSCAPSSAPRPAFSGTDLRFTEPGLSVWAQLVNLAGSRLEKHKIKKSPKRGFADDGAAASPDLGDMSPEGLQPPMILLQQSLASATQLSLVRPYLTNRSLRLPAPPQLMALGSAPVCPGRRAGCVSAFGCGVHASG
ncbi:putative HERC2-like protein 3 [Camelus ferus]|uniref:HERC2-like protein 3 n=1 Tax=Camelus ferus TaxID=419612 RepID=A0A8B8SIN8_CAMFR|nr:putative HERC2-like protein 3 [Camelus ferus]